MNKLFKSKAAKIIVWFLIATIITMFVFVLIVNLIRSEINKTTFDQQFMNFENWIIALVIAAAVNAFMFYSLFKKQFKFIRDSKEQVHGNAKFLIDERKEVSNKAIENFNKEYSNNAVPAFVARIYKDKNKKISFNTILAENKQSTVHTLILGATGAGKTWRFVYPTLYYNMKLGYDKKPNIFVTDVKGEIATKFRDEFKHHDYDVVEINLSDPFKSNRWNPLAKVYDMWNEYLNFENEKCEEAVRLKTEIDAEINNIIEPFFADKKIGENAEWVIGAENIVKGVVWYLLEFCFNELKPEQFNLPAVKSIISSQQNKLMQDLKKIQAKHPLAKCFGFLNDPFVNCASEKQVSGYIGSVSSSLAILENQGIKYLLSDNEIDFVEMLSSDVNEKTKKPKIIFFIIPDEDSTRYAIATLFINQFYNTGVKVSRKFETQALPRTLLFVGDEFFNIPRVKDMQQKIAVARSRNIFFGLIAQNDATCIINLNHMKSDKVVSEFNKVITSNRVNFLTTKRSKHLQNQKQLYQMEKLDQLANDISIDLDSLKKSQIYFIQYDRDEKKLLKKVNLFQSWLKEKKIILNNLTFLQFEAFKNCNLGCNGGMTLNELQLPMSAFSYGYMFLTTKLNDPNGMFLGINNSNNVVFLDTFRIDENRKNHNIVVLGTSGSGKSTTVKKIVNDDLFNDRKVFIIDPESEYKCLSDKYDGFYVNFGSGQNGRINPLQITWTDEGSSSRSLMIDEHINFITSWIRTLYNQNTISERTLIMFKRVLKDFYTSLNFYDKQKIDINQLTKKDYPTFTDLIDYMETYKCLRDEEFDYKSLHTLLKDEFKDKQLYDGHSTLSVTNRINVFDLKNLFEKANPNVKQAQMLLMLNYIQQEINTNNLLEKDKKKQIRVVVDEAHLLIDKDNQNGLNFIFQMVKRIRKYNGSILIVTQNPNDFVGDETIVKKTTAIINNAQYSFIMNLSSNDVQAIDRLYKESGGLTQNEKNFIATARKGYGLLVSNVNERQIVSVELFDFEKEIFNLNYAS